MSDHAEPSNGERKVVAGLPPWCASVKYTSGAIVVTARVPVPAMPQLEQLAYQRDSWEQHVAMGVIGVAPPTFDLELALSEEQAASLRDALDELLVRASSARDVVDVASVIDVD